jgi:hypothetical protein
MGRKIKVTDEVKVINPLSKLKDLEGKVVEIKEYAPAWAFVVDLKEYGKWSFREIDIELKKQNK